MHKRIILLPKWKFRFYKSVEFVLAMIIFTVFTYCSWIILPMIFFAAFVAAALPGEKKRSIYLKPEIKHDMYSIRSGMR